MYLHCTGVCLLLHCTGVHILGLDFIFLDCGMLLLDKISMEKEERELRELLPKAALLHNCLVLHLAEAILYLIVCAVCLLVVFDHL